MVKLTIEIKDKGIKDLLIQAQAKLGDLKPVMKTISETMLHAVEENFVTEGRRLPGGKWKKLEQSTEDRREKKGKWPGKILEVERNLIGSVSSYGDSNTAIVGSSMPFKKGYAAIHQFGGKAGRGRKVTIPARPYLVLTDGDMEEIRQDILDYLEK